MIGPLKTVTGPKHISLGPVIKNTWTPLWSQFRDISLLDTSSLLGTKIDNGNNNGYNVPAQINVELPHRTSWPAKWNIINKAEDQEYRSNLFHTCREVVNTPFPLIPFPAVILVKGWVRVQLDPDPPVPYLRIQKWYELKLEVPNQET